MPVFNRPCFGCVSWSIALHSSYTELLQSRICHCGGLIMGGATKSHNLSVALWVNNVLMKNEAAWQEVMEASCRGTPQLPHGSGIIWTDRGTFCLYMHVEKWCMRPQEKRSLSDLTMLKWNQNLTRIYGYGAHDSPGAAIQSSGFMSRD